MNKMPRKNVSSNTPANIPAAAALATRPMATDLVSRKNGVKTSAAVIAATTKSIETNAKPRPAAKSRRAGAPPTRHSSFKRAGISARRHTMNSRIPEIMKARSKVRWNGMRCGINAGHWVMNQSAPRDKTGLMAQARASASNR